MEIVIDFPNFISFRVCFRRTALILLFFVFLAIHWGEVPGTANDSISVSFVVAKRIFDDSLVGRLINGLVFWRGKATEILYGC